jgi:uncharacterized protein (DUF2147 family)
MRWLLRLPLLACVCLAAIPVRAQPSPVGYWQTRDGGGVVEVTQCGEAICAHLAGIVLDRPEDPMPTDWRGVSQCDLTLIAGAQPIEPNLWRGKITDPRNGHVYGVELHITGRGQLAVRGFLGIALLGRTDYWTRYYAVPPANCRMTPSQARQGGSGSAG